MAYNNGYPMNYPQYYQPIQNQNYPQNQNIQNYPQNPQSYPQQQQQIQNGGFISVPSEEVARNYPVGPGNSVTFKNENAPYVYTKTMGFSQLDRPIFEKYKLVREEDAKNDEISAQTAPKNKDAYNEAIEDVKGQIKAIYEDIDDIKKRLEKVEDLGA